MLTQLDAQMNAVSFFSVYCNNTLNSVSYKMYSLVVAVLSWTSKICRLSGNMLRYNDFTYIYTHTLFLMSQQCQKMDITDGTNVNLVKSIKTSELYLILL